MMNHQPLQTYKLAAQQLSLGYDRKTIILDLNLVIPKHQISILIGPNGCGKSTLLRGLARLLKPRAGGVYLDGKLMSELHTKAIAKKMAILTQNPTIPEGLTVRDLVAQGRYPYQNWWQQWSTKDEKSVEEALLLTGMKELADSLLHNLSGGQRQRAWIAMALAQDTDILLLDEPTTFLDLAHQIEILDLLSQLNQLKQRTIVMVLHDLNLACRYAHNLIILKQGQIYAQGKPEKAMTEEMIREVFNLDCYIFPDPLTATPMCIPLSRRSNRSKFVQLLF